MANVWIYSENADIAKELVTAGKQIGDVCVVATDEIVANTMASVGVAKVILLKGNSEWAEAYGKEIAATLKEEGAEIVLVGATAKGKAIAAEVATLLDAGLATEAVKIAVDNNTLLVDRFTYGGLSVSTETIAFPAFATIPARSYEPAPEGEAVAVTTKEVNVETSVTVVSTESANQGGVDLNKADKVVAIGRGVEGQDGLALAQELATAVSAEVGCSRPVAEEAKLLPIERYIGISGKTLKGNLYFGVGTSGQIQHIAGVRDVKTVVAINSDESAPIFAAADYGIVGDYKEVLPALIAAINAAK